MTPLPMSALTPEHIKRFESRVRRSDPDKCWEWQTKEPSTEYGRLIVGTRGYKASRIAYFLHYGKDPGSQMVCHTCDNPPCCNPSHLFLGDALANARDMIAKGRHSHGERHSKRVRETHAVAEDCATSKLTNARVLEIRALYFEGNVSMKELSQQYDVSYTAINGILSRTTWASLPKLPCEPAVDYNKKRLGERHGSKRHPEKWRRGESVNTAKLTADNVRQLRVDAQTCSSYVELGRRYGITSTMARYIVTRQSWKHID